MRASWLLLLASASVTCGEQQIPLAEKVKGWLGKAESASSAYSSGVAKAAGMTTAEQSVEHVTLENWKSVLSPLSSDPSTGPEAWLLFVTGGNNTCWGMCDRAEGAWNRSVPTLIAQANCPHLAMIDCETEQVLCNSWAASPPSIYHILLPKPLPDQSKPETTIHRIGLNRTSVAPEDITRIVTEKKFFEEEPLSSIFHPFDGFLAKNGLALPVGYAITYISMVPSWLFMLVISMVGRTWVSKRVQAREDARTARAQRAAGKQE